MLTTNKSFLQPTGFRVVINGEYKNLEFFAQSAQHPGAAVNAVEVGIPKLSLPLLGDKITFSELSINLILDEDMTSYREMQGWLEDAIGDDHDKAVMDISIIVLTSHNNKNITIKYKDCIPTTIGAIDFNSTLGDASYLTFDASFRFSTYEIL